MNTKGKTMNKFGVLTCYYKKIFEENYGQKMLYTKTVWNT